MHGRGMLTQAGRLLAQWGVGKRHKQVRAHWSVEETAGAGRPLGRLTAEQAVVTGSEGQAAALRL